MKINKIFFVLGVLGLMAISAFAAVDTLSSDVDKLVGQGVGTAKVAGGGLLYMAAGWVPMTIILGATIIGYFGALKEKQPNDSAMKMITATISNGAYGYLGAVVVWALIGLLATGDPTKGVNMTIHFWKSGVQQVAGTDVFSK